MANRNGVLFVRSQNAQFPVGTEAMSIQDAETLQLLISTAITAQDKREWASGQGNNVIGERGRGNYRVSHYLDQ